jgi:hypothetical protein
VLLEDGGRGIHERREEEKKRLRREKSHEFPAIIERTRKWKMKMKKSDGNVIIFDPIKSLGQS